MDRRHRSQVSGCSPSLWHPVLGMNPCRPLLPQEPQAGLQGTPNACGVAADWVFVASNPTQLFLLQFQSANASKSIHSTPVGICNYVFNLFLKLFFFIEIQCIPRGLAGVAQLVGASSPIPQGPGFCSWSRHVPRPLAGHVQEAPGPCWFLSLSLPPHLSKTQ